jgi:putative hydrolase of the HAD superfamily
MSTVPSKDNANRAYDVLLLDFGGVCLFTPFELNSFIETAAGLPQGSITSMGPFDPSTDDLWTELFSSDTLREREYWERRAALLSKELGRPIDTHGYMRLAYEPSRPELVRDEANDVVRLAQAAGLGVSILTNDMTAFHGAEWKKGIPLVQQVDHVVDCSDTGILKPDKRAYERALSFVGVEADRVLFVDDMKLNIEGAAEVGMHTYWFDVTAASSSWAEVARLIGV